jgi:phosphoribosylamine--glycine ligase
MKILLIGSGGREHALAWKIAQSPLVTKIYCAPGNPGIGEIAELVQIDADKIQELLHFAKSHQIDLTVVGPELPLTLGIVDAFQKEKLKIFGPCQQAAQLEASKDFAKKMMAKYGIPTAAFKTFDDVIPAIEYLEKHPYPVVVKADGLAAGKGVLVAKDFLEAKNFLLKIMEDKIFGKAGSRVVIEECLEGKEVSVLALIDGKTVLTLPEARDHKRVFDHDAGPNTGGMGAFSPVDDAPKNLISEALHNVFEPLLRGLNQEGILYQGVLYAGLMLTQRGPKVLEFNVRFGDPETQVILPRIKNDLVALMLSCCEQKLNKEKIEILPEAAVCIVVASGGYPDAYKNGFTIHGLESVKASAKAMVFHAGTRKDASSGHYMTQGGRVLAVTALGGDMSKARDLAYQQLGKINFENHHYRKDIGLEKN